jgi:hypothetical protein
MTYKVVKEVFIYLYIYLFLFIYLFIRLLVFVSKSVSFFLPKRVLDITL